MTNFQQQKKKKKKNLQSDCLRGAWVTTQKLEF